MAEFIKNDVVSLGDIFYRSYSDDLFKTEYYYKVEELRGKTLAILRLVKTITKSHNDFYYSVTIYRGTEASKNDKYMFPKTRVFNVRESGDVLLIDVGKKVFYANCYYRCAIDEKELYNP